MEALSRYGRLGPWIVPIMVNQANSTRSHCSVWTFSANVRIYFIANFVRVFIFTSHLRKICLCCPSLSICWAWSWSPSGFQKPESCWVWSFVGQCCYVRFLLPSLFSSSLTRAQDNTTMHPALDAIQIYYFSWTNAQRWWTRAVRWLAICTRKICIWTSRRMV